jgi:hypothetical protein
LPGANEPVMPLQLQRNNSFSKKGSKNSSQSTNSQSETISKRHNSEFDVVLDQKPIQESSDRERPTIQTTLKRKSSYFIKNFRE